MNATMQPYVPGKRQPAHMPKGKLSRWSELKIWWREIDRVLLLLVFGGLMARLWMREGQRQALGSSTSDLPADPAL